MSKASKSRAERNRVAAALLSSAWSGGISELPCLDVPLPANVFGKDGATVKATWGVPWCPSAWGTSLLEASLHVGACEVFLSSSILCFLDSIRLQVVPKVFCGGLCTTAVLHSRRNKVRGEKQGLSLDQLLRLVKRDKPSEHTGPSSG